MPDRSPAAHTGPLILGASGHIGRMWQILHAAGHWPGPDPLWHARRSGGYAWDMNGPAPDDPRLGQVGGMFVLAGVTQGDAAALAGNAALATAALDLAARHAIGPVLLCSSVAVYGRPAPGARPATETDRITATAGYGAAKAAMENAAAAHRWPSTCLRIGNVIGADAVLRAAARGPVRLDRLADGTSPRRAMIGPRSLAAVMTGLIAAHRAGAALPAVLNVAQPGEIAMADLLDAAGVPFDWQDAGPATLAALPIDLSALAALVPIIPATAPGLIAEARSTGWRAFGEKAGAA